jgi:Cof subfamily protein (haloacid dehalogenase superfamily)
LYKLVAIDVDGTLLNDQKEITKEVKEAIQAVKAKGVNVVICTGRPIGGVRPILEELNLADKDEYVITYNGAIVQKNNSSEVVSETSLTVGDLKVLYELSQQLGSPMHFFDTERIYTPNKDISHYTIYESFVNKVPLSFRTIEEIPEDMLIPKVMFIDEPERLNEIMAAIPASFREKYTMVQSAPFFLEILHPSVNKGNAVKQLAEKLSVKQEEVICMGDGENDLEMVKYAGCGVAMGNAVPSVEEVAEFQTLTNNEHGVAYALEKLILNK